MTENSSRDRMIAAAVTLFARAGFHGVTAKEIAQRAHVSDGNIFRYFPTMRDLFLCAIESELRKLSLRAQEEVARITCSEAPGNGLRGVLNLITETMMKKPELVRLLHFSALEFKSDVEPMFERHIYPVVEALASCGEMGDGNDHSREVRALTTFLFFIATVILMQDFFPSFSGCPSPFESIESAASAYTELWHQKISTAHTFDPCVLRVATAI